MKKLLVSLIVLGLLINWMPTSAEADSPTVTISDVPTTEQNDAFDLTITFSEDVTGFETGDLTVTGEATATAVAAVGTSKTNYTATITPNAGKEGDVTVTVDADAVIDAGGNGNTASAATDNIHIDTIMPPATITSVPTTEQKEAFNLTITFSEDVTGFAKEDLTVTGEATATSVSGSGSSYTATITPNAGKEGYVTVKVDADAVIDAAGNKNTASFVTRNIRVDTIVPTVAISGVPTTEQNGAFALTITFSEDVTDFETGDLTVTGEATATAVAAVGTSQTNYTATITPNAGKEEDVTVTVNASAVTDNAGNANTASSATGNIHIDTIRPTATISGVPTTDQNAPFDLTITFSEDVTGFAPDDLTVTGEATATAVVAVGTSKTNYTATITPNAGKEGDVTVTVNADAVVDAAGNGNTASVATGNIPIDTKRPTVTSITGVPTTPQSGAFDLTVTFSEDVTGDFAVWVTGNLSFITRLSGSGSIWTVTITPQPVPSGEEDVTVKILGNTTMDAAGNWNITSDATDSIPIDTKRPTVTSITGVPTTPQSGAFDLTVTFSEDVTGFGTDALTVTGEATATAVAAVGASKSSYTATITPTVGKEGDVTVTVNADGVVDAAGNGNTASAATDSISIDTKRPTVTSITGVPTTPQNGAFVLTITFSEDVIGIGDIMTREENTEFGAIRSMEVTGSGRSRTLTITPEPNVEDSLTVTVLENGVVDAAGNGNTASAATDSIHVDTKRPTVTSIIGVPTTPQNGAFDLTVTFSEDVTGFAPDDLTVTGEATATAVAAVGTSKTNYTATITPNVGKEGDVTVTVNADGVVDAAGNGNTASVATDSIPIDTIRPTVTSITGVPTTPQNGAFDLTIKFSEDVTGFGTDALTVTGEATATAVAAVGTSKTNYTATITPTVGKEGDVTVTVNADGVVDAAGNGNTASDATDSIPIDTKRPTVASITGVPTTEQNGVFALTITFSEDVTGIGDITMTEDAEFGVIASAVVSGSDRSRTVTITPEPNVEGSITVTVVENSLQDAAGNGNTAFAVTPNIHIDTIVPTVAISDVPPTEQNGAFDLTITFSEEVNGFEVPADLTVTGPGTASLKSGAAGGAAYVVTVTPSAASEEDVTVAINASAVQDMATNANPVGSNTATVHIDTIPPTATISDVPTTPQNGPFELTITFNEDVTGFAAADLTVTGPVATTLSGSGSSYTATITPNATAEGDVTVQVSADAVDDAAGNKNPVSAATSSVHVDTIPPTATISGVPTTEQNGAFALTITFSEDVTGIGNITMIEDAEFGVVGSAVVSGSGRRQTLTITPDANAEGSITVQVDENSVKDAAGNGNTASAPTPNIHVDTIPPTVSVAFTPLTVEANGYETEERNAPYDLTVTFSEEVNGFALSDLAVTGPGSATALEGSDGDIVYTVTITPDEDAEGDVTVTVDANTVEDFATNQNPAGSEPVTVYIDTIAPTFTIEDTPVLQRINDFFDIRIVFSEAVNDFRVPADFTASDLVTPSLQSGADGASEYIVRMTPNEAVQGNLFIEVNAETVQDFALNLNADAVATTQPVRIDTIAPTVEITDLPTGVKAEPFEVTITFAEAVNGFTTEDIALVGPATVQLTSGTDGDAVYTASVVPAENAGGNVTLQIPAAVVEDFAGNVNLASDLTEPIPINTSTLIVELQDVPDTVQLDDFSVTIVFSRDVEGFVLGDIEITGDAVIQSSTLLGTGRTYALTITPDENTDGDVIITVPAGVAQDAAGNSNAASVPQTVSVAPGWMPDASLRAAFRERLGLSPGEDFTQQQLRTITTLESGIIGINDLKGAEQATTLTTLVMPGSGITDITSLRRLTQLTTLDLADNAITDLTPLSGLTELTSLNLSGNGLTSIAALEDLTSLTTLDLSNNALTDISPLAALTRLTTLNLNGNSIADFTPLTGLTALTTLDLGGTGLSSLNAISGLTGLTSLNVRDNSLTDIAPLANLAALTALDLSGNTVSDLTGLSGLTGLTVLDLNDNAVIDITPLASLTRLTTLALADNAITTLTPLTALTVLTYLNLADNSITDVAPLAGLASLETLRLVGNPILNTAPLYPLTQGVPSVDIDIEVSQYPPWDVNEDGTVDATDSALVTAALGQSGNAIENPRTDVNGDGTVDNADLTLVTANLTLVTVNLGVAGAPAAAHLLSQLDAKTLGTLDRETLEMYLNQLRVESDGSLKYREAIAMLEGLLAVLRPTETRLLANYPNPFNPETWLPYELAVDSDVEIFIYNARGVLVRHLELGHQSAGYYVAKSRAAYWDGRNRHGERVSSGFYFYQLRAGDISQLRKMVILK